jgi:hypothetical protein
VWPNQYTEAALAISFDVPGKRTAPGDNPGRIHRGLQVMLPPQTLPDGHAVSQSSHGVPEYFWGGYQDLWGKGIHLSIYACATA